ncbi:hypothetical protein NW762_012446 [Fusarium torreyae]|uniref:Uncharacterized protein n=1 Tax=Fusarium torreyae TaxID=1237075 RepID=A0A9W8RMJ3_9HYPO|nr:hypothetical protein NW762_012446 [Fusarium torreyae]
MKPVSILAPLFVFFSFGAAIPQGEPSNDGSVVEADVEPLPGVKIRKEHLFVCDSAPFKGRCQNLENDAGKCYNLGNRWPNTISSVKPSKGTTCTLYNLFDCKGKKLNGIHRPGIANLADNHFNDMTNSFRCS